LFKKTEVRSNKQLGITLTVLTALTQAHINMRMVTGSSRYGT